MNIRINTFTKIIKILEFSFSYEDFMRTKNHFIENGIINKIRKKSTKKQWQEYCQRENVIKNNFYKEYIKDNPNIILREIRGLINIYYATINDIIKII